MKKYKSLIITFTLLSLTEMTLAQVTRLSNTSTGVTEYIGWDGSGLATPKDLDIQNNYSSYNINLSTFNGSLIKRMTILSTGEVGIGNFTPVYKLDIDAGDINVNSPTNGYRLVSTSLGSQYILARRNLCVKASA